MISIIVPGYKNAPYMKLLLQSIHRTEKIKHGDPYEVIVVLDDCEDEYLPLTVEYPDVRFFAFPRHVGFATALNHGVEMARGDQVLLVNEDNVFPWDWHNLDRLPPCRGTVWTVGQVEPMVSTLGHGLLDLGRDLSSWDWQEWDRQGPRSQKKVTDDAHVFPILMSRELYLRVGGFDPTYPTPFVSDLDFMWKLQYMDPQFYVGFKRTHLATLYHFVSKSTKFRDDGRVISGEEAGMIKFSQKWGAYPRRNEDNSIRLTK